MAERKWDATLLPFTGVVECRVAEATVSMSKSGNPLLSVILELLDADCRGIRLPLFLLMGGFRADGTPQVVRLFEFTHQTFGVDDLFVLSPPESEEERQAIAHWLVGRRVFMQLEVETFQGQHFTRPAHAVSPSRARGLRELGACRKPLPVMPVRPTSPELMKTLTARQEEFERAKTFALQEQFRLGPALDSLAEETCSYEEAVRSVTYEGFQAANQLSLSLFRWLQLLFACDMAAPASELRLLKALETLTGKTRWEAFRREIIDIALQGGLPFGYQPQHPTEDPNAPPPAPQEAGTIPSL